MPAAGCCSRPTSKVPPSPSYYAIPRHWPPTCLVAPHHGSGETLTPAFIAAVHPSVIVASSAARLTAKQRRFDQIVGGHVVRTAATGAVTVTVTPDGRVAVGTFLTKAAHRR